ncbi:sensor histidine kinase [Phytoactinopolyspora endophytica]|uniref:sensor histidine kinase n=1 Tax=Phytoactinopolyspora endophytica TaxID=1642495 RepID=UPI00197BBC74|nr:histidine kinase [Phytoactinopolyspora endophytica]
MTEPLAPSGLGWSGSKPVLRHVFRWVRTFAGVVLGALSAVLELVFLVLAGFWLLIVMVVPRARGAGIAWVYRCAQRLAGLEWRRLVTYTAANDRSTSDGGVSPAASARTLGYLAARLVPGALSAFIVGLLVIGTILAFMVVRATVLRELALIDLLLQIIIGAALLMVPVHATSNVAALDHRLANTFLLRGPRQALERRVDELATSRTEVIAAVDAERQRIERDLHDGLQQRLVALGMLLGRARRSADMDKVSRLVTQAHEDAQRAIDDLRDVAWRVYPSALEHTGLDEVLTMVAKQFSVPVKIACDLPVRPARQVETVVYFVACEAITNAAKHSGASVIAVDINRRGTVVELRVHDDGTGGADPSGSGLRGLARRVEALDGRFQIDSPPGGPTTLRAELPCE